MLDWFAARQRADGLMGRVEWWPFVDWSPPQFDGGVPPQGADGGSSALTLQFVEALRYAAELEDRFGEKDRAARYLELAKRASESLMRLSWDEKAGLLADTPEKKDFSQQANSLAVWLDVIPKEKQRAVMEKVLAGRACCIWRRLVIIFGSMWLGRWFMRDWGMSMWLSWSRGGRCWGWGFRLGGDAGANAVGFACVERASYVGSAGDGWGDCAGDAAGFERVRIAPHLGKLQHVSATMPTPKGLVEVGLRERGVGGLRLLLCRMGCLGI